MLKSSIQVTTLHKTRSSIRAEQLCGLFGIVHLEDLQTAAQTLQADIFCDLTEHSSRTDIAASEAAEQEMIQSYGAAHKCF